MLNKWFDKYYNYALIIIGVFILGLIIGASCIRAQSTEINERDSARGTEETPARVDVAEMETAEAETAETTAAPKYDEITVTVTAYCACVKCCGKADGITATGTKATAGRTIAVDPHVIPYGTEVIINGNTYVAEDCGGAIKDNRIDIYFNTHQEALNFGRQQLTALILK